MIYRPHFAIGILFSFILISLNKTSGDPTAIRGRNLRSPFDYHSYYESVYVPERTRSVTPRGIALRQSTNPTSITDQIRGTGFVDIKCDILTRTWSVTYMNSLEDIFGDTALTAIGNCFVSKTGFPSFELTPLIGTKNVSVDPLTGSEITNELFVLDSTDTKQNVLQCTFQLFVIQDPNSTTPSAFQTPTLIKTANHECDRSDSLHCDFWAFGCKIDADQFKGAAIFWYFIYLIEIAVLTIIGLAFFTMDMSRIQHMHEDAISHIYSQDSRSSGSELMSEKLRELGNEDLIQKLEQIRTEKAELALGPMPDYYRYGHGSYGYSHSGMPSPHPGEAAKGMYRPDYPSHHPPKHLHHSHHLHQQDHHRHHEADKRNVSSEEED